VKFDNTTRIAIPFLASLLLFAVLFLGFLGNEKVLLTTDALIARSNLSFSDAIHNLVPGWSSFSLLGSARGGSISVANFFKGVSPDGITWNNLIYGLACLFTSFALIAYLLRKKLSRHAVLFGVITACWVGSNFTLMYAGHANKPFVLFFFILSLLSVSFSGLSSVGKALLFGGCVGLMFAQQPDVAMFFALFAGAHLIFHLWQGQGCKPLKWLKILVPAAAIAFLFAAGPLLSGYKHHVKNTAQVQTQSPQEKWDYMTQWSWPPEESIAFIAPGYTGWRSGEPEGPYWGRMGRSADWEQSRQGYMNFKMESTYLGIIPVAFALFALFACRRSPHRAEIIFWGGAATIALLLAFGKFFPLYSLFYKLPVVNNIRNPNKFLQVFQVCVAILTAYGADRLFSQRSKVESQKSEDLSSDLCPLTPEPRRFFWGLVGVSGLLVLWALSASLNRAEGITNFATQGWPDEAARVIAANRIKALWHASFMAAVVAAVFAMFSFAKLGKLLRFRNWIADALVLIVAADAVKLSRHYVKEMPRSYIETNALTDFLKKNLGHQRVALLTQQSIYNIWLTYLLPYNRISAFNFAQMPRMAEDYKNFLAAGSKNPLRMWRFSAVKYLLGPAAFEQQLPAGQFKKVFAYNVGMAPDNELRLIPDPSGTHAVFELLESVPRYALLLGAEPETDEQILVRIADGQQPLMSGQGIAGLVEVVKYRPGCVELRTQSDEPALLRVAERWDPDWKATVDGRSTEVQSVDYLCQGVALPAGAHTVTLTYSPSRLFFYMQCGGYAVLLATGILTILRKREST